MLPPKQNPIPIIDTAYHQQWQFSRFSYLEQPRPNHGLLLLLEGQMDYVNQKATLYLQPMDLVYLPKGSRYEARFHPGTEDLLINFHFADGGGEDLPTEPCPVLRDSLGTLRPLMEQTVALFQEEGRFLEAMSLFYRFCHQITLALQSENGEQALIPKAKALLSRPDCPGVDAVARQLLISPSGLRKKFKDSEGIPPARYRMVQKVESAKQLLLSTDLSLSAIADRCGFCDEAYFHKVFCKTAGVTPTAYRNSRSLPD